MNFEQQYFHKAVAFVLKNFIQSKNKVVIFHKSLGKITCIYPYKHAASRLCTGSIIVCDVVKQGSRYKFEYLDIVFVPLGYSLTKLSFLHDLFKICLNLLPSNIACSDVFNLLVYVYKNIEKLEKSGQQILLLRLFLVFDLLPEKKQIYCVAMQNPIPTIKQETFVLQDFVEQCWQLFDEEIKQHT